MSEVTTVSWPVAKEMISTPWSNNLSRQRLNLSFYIATELLVSLACTKL